MTTDIETRLAVLERSVSRWKAISTVLLILVCAALCIGAAESEHLRSLNVDVLTVKALKADMIQVGKGLAVMNEKDQALIFLGNVDGKGGLLRVSDGANSADIVGNGLQFEAGEKKTLEIGQKEGTPGLLMYSPGGDQMVVLGTHGDKTALRVGRGKSNVLIAADESTDGIVITNAGTECVGLGVDQKAKPSGFLEIGDASFKTSLTNKSLRVMAGEKPLMQIGQSDDGHGGDGYRALKLFSTSGEEMASLSTLGDDARLKLGSDKGTTIGLLTNGELASLKLGNTKNNVAIGCDQNLQMIAVTNAGNPCVTIGADGMKRPGYGMVEVKDEKGETVWTTMPKK